MPKIKILSKEKAINCYEDNFKRKLNNLPKKESKKVYKRLDKIWKSGEVDA